LVAKNNELTEKDNLLKEEISGLKRQLDDMRAKYDDLQGRVGALSDENQRLVNEAADAPKVLADLGLNIENHLQHIHDVLSNVTNLRKNH
jgi:chromosome segregation ATPase